MKKFLALALMVLMVVPFGIISASADAAVPAEPTVEAGAKKVYIAYNGKGDGSSAESTINSSGWSTNGKLHNELKGGAIGVVVGKCYFGATATFSKTDKPVLFTAVDGDKNYTGTIDNDADANANGIPDGQGTQTGMFLVGNSFTMSIEGTVIFKDITLLDRTKHDENEAAGKAVTATYKVLAGANIVLGDNVTIACSKNDVEYSKLTPILDIEEGGYAYLHSVGFSKYTGKGTIVLDRALVDAGKVTKDTFAGFEGTIVAQDGSDPFAAATPGTPSTPTTPENPSTPSNPETGDVTFVIVAIALASVAGAVLTLKKRSVR